MLCPRGNVVGDEAAVVAGQFGRDSHPALEDAAKLFFVLEIGSQIDLQFVDPFQVLAQMLLPQDDLVLRRAVSARVVSVQRFAVPNQIRTLEKKFSLIK